MIRFFRASFGFILLVLPFTAFGQKTLDEKLISGDPGGLRIHYSSMYTESDEYFFEDGAYAWVHTNREQDSLTVAKGTWRRGVGSPVVRVTPGVTLEVVGSGERFNGRMGFRFYERHSIMETKNGSPRDINWAKLAALNGVPLGSAQYDIYDIDEENDGAVKDNYRRIAEDFVRTADEAFPEVKKRQSEPDKD